MKNSQLNYVAELSANHNNSFERALKIIEAVAEAGATSVKFQTYTAETMTLELKRDEFLVPSSNALWGGRSLYELYEEAHTPWSWHKDLFQACRQLGLTPFSSPFDKSAVDLLEDLDCEIYKIASFEIVDTELISYVASTGKPLIMSTGMATVREIAIAYEAAIAAGANDITLLKTTSAYPASPLNSNLLTMPKLGELFGTKFGVSDHTLGIGVSVAAAALGASVIEKHVTLRREDGGVDDSFSMEPAEFGQLIVESERAKAAMGEIHFGPTDGDRESLQFRRSLYVACDVVEGEKVSPDNVRAIRPGLGLPIQQLASVLGMHFTKNVKKGTPMSFDLLR